MRTHRLSRWLTIAVAFVAAVGFHGHVFGQSAPSNRVQQVVLVSFDGGKPTVMRQSAMPELMAMAAGGAVTWQAQTVFPPITLVAHTSMLTGVVPEKHHVTWNSWLPAKGPVAVPTIFQIARAHGAKTALFAGKEKFRHFDISNTLDRLVIETNGALRVARAAAIYIAAEKPNLCFIHFPDSDTAGHAHGWGSPAQIKAFADEDAALQIVRAAVEKAGLEPTCTWILTADHGGHKRGHGERIPEDMTIPWIAYGCRARAGFIITNAVSTCDSAATALWLLGIPVPAGWDGKPVVSAFTN